MITKSVRTLIVVLILVVISAFALTACTPKVAEAPTETVLVKLKIGASPVPHAEILAYIRDNLAAQPGLKSKLSSLPTTFNPTWR